jgi:hypothetical protein
VNENLIQGIWARSTACLVVSTLAFALGGAVMFAVVDQSYGGHATPTWLVNALTVLGASLFALGATMWVRACALITRRMRARRIPPLG